jgi:hypothetical protein
VAAGEDQAQRVVADGAVGRRRVGVAVRLDQRVELGDELRLPVLEPRAASQPVDRLVARGAEDPRARDLRSALGRPLLERGGERLRTTSSARSKSPRVRISVARIRPDSSR